MLQEKGFVLVGNVLSSCALDELPTSCEELYKLVRLCDPAGLGQQILGRYLFGAIGQTLRFWQQKAVEHPSLAFLCRR